MECDDRKLLEQWMDRWKDLMEFEVLPVVTPAEAAANLARGKLVTANTTNTWTVCEIGSRQAKALWVYTHDMSVAIRSWVLGALVLAIAPAVALACDDESKSTSGSASVSSSSSTSSKSSKSSTSAIKVKNYCKVKVDTAIKLDNKCSSEFKTINADGERGSGWSPGHLIEPDTMKPDPSEEQQTPDAEWVTISYVNGSVQSVRKGERSRKSRTAVRTGASGPTVQSAPNPF